MTDGIILAGGYSSRLGKNKMNVLFKNKPVILHTIKQMKAACENVYLVTGFYHDEIIELVKDLDDIHVTYNPNYDQGMFSSIKHGVQYVQNNFFIIPGDYPLVNTEIYNQLKLGTKAIRVPSFSFKLGHPIYFDYTFKEKILNTSLSDLKSFRNQYDFEIINVKNSGILFDIDTSEDLDKLKERSDILNVNEYVVVDYLEEAYQLLNQDKKNHILAGGAWLKLSVKEVNKLISLDHLSLNYIKEEEDYLEIGALTTLRDLEMSPALKAIDQGILPLAISKIMGVTIRNLATIGGSIMGKFSFSDILPVLLVLDCRLFFHNRGEMKIEDFVNSRVLEKDILTHIRINKGNSKSFFKKVSHTALDFSMVNLAITYDGNFKISVGSQPRMAMLCKETMTFLNQAEDLTDEVYDQAISLAINELKLSTNLRASKAYREVLVKTYLKRGIRQVIK